MAVGIPDASNSCSHWNGGYFERPAACSDKQAAEVFEAWEWNVEGVVIRTGYRPSRADFPGRLDAVLL
jgi:hypothetical protein